MQDALMAFETRVPAGRERVKAFAPSGQEELAADARQWDLYRVVQQVRQVILALKALQVIRVIQAPVLQ